MKTIAIDATPLLEKQWGGVSWYSFYIINGLIECAARRELRVFLFYNSFRPLNDKISSLLKKWRRAENVFVVGYRMPNKFLNLSMRFLKTPYIDELVENRIRKQELRIKNIDLFFVPNLSFLTLSSKTPYIAVCHDLSFEIFPEFFTLRQRLWHWLINPRKFYKNAQRVIAVSENTKKDLMDLYEIDKSRIDVVYPGIDEAVFYPRDESAMRSAREKYKLPDSFILSVGTLEPRKNYESLLEAFDMMCELPILTKEGTVGRFDSIPPYEGGTKGGSPTLVIIGQEGWKYDRIYRFLNRMKHKSQVKFLFNVSREDLPALYSATQLFVYPSFYEGFGFPPLEAAACGTPIIVGHGSSLPEVMGGAALYVDPFNVADIARAMERLFCDEKLRGTLQKTGIEQAKKFIWKNTVQNIALTLAK